MNRLSATVRCTFKLTRMLEPTVLLRIIAVLWTLMNTNSEEIVKVPGRKEEYCNSELFQPRCAKNEVILMESATYGRMRIGRCITAEEVSALGPLGRDDPRILGCSANVLSILDRKCSGESHCEIRTADVSYDNVKPCLPGLVLYLEVTYDCFTVVDDERSCSVALSANPTHIIGSMVQKKCGTESHPWTVEAPIGQKISITLIDFSAFAIGQTERRSSTSLCFSYGLIVDRAGKRNATICADEEQRVKELYTSGRNAVDVIFTSHKDNFHNGSLFLLQLEAIGCSDIIPPEDAWLRRNGDEIVIGCYSSRKSWHLYCKVGNWIGVIGNCSQDETHVHDSGTVSETRSKVTNDELIVGSIAIAGFTLAICMAIVCIGFICLRRVQAKRGKGQDYKTMKVRLNSDRNLTMNGTFPSSVATGFDGNDLQMQQMPMYSVYVGQSAEDNSVP